MICKNCGSQINEKEKFCKNCGSPVSIEKQKTVKGFLPSFIIGLIASICGIGGGFCMTLCDSIFSGGVAPFVLIFGGSIVGLVGACKCLNNVLIGSILQLIAAIMIMICAYGITGSGLMSVFAMILFIVSGIIGMIYAFTTMKR